MERTINSAIDEKIAEIKAGTIAYGTGRVRLVREYIVEATGLDDVCAISSGSWWATMRRATWMPCGRTVSSSR